MGLAPEHGGLEGAGDPDLRNGFRDFGYPSAPSVLCQSPGRYTGLEVLLCRGARPNSELKTGLDTPSERYIDWPGRIGASILEIVHAEGCRSG